MLYVLLVHDELQSVHAMWISLWKANVNHRICLKKHRSFFFYILFTHVVKSNLWSEFIYTKINMVLYFFLNFRNEGWACASWGYSWRIPVWWRIIILLGQLINVIFWWYQMNNHLFSELSFKQIIYKRKNEFKHTYWNYIYLSYCRVIIFVFENLNLLL